MFADTEIKSSSQIIATSDHTVLLWHSDTGRWRELLYDRRFVIPGTFTNILERSGEWATIRGAHVLVWLGELGDGELLDWEPATGIYRVFPGVPDTA